MLNILFDFEKELAQHLSDINSWNNIYVDYHKPYVKRLWKQIGENRIYLHQIEACKKIESLLHPHPWPSAMKVIKGCYEMGVGYSKEKEKPVIASKLILSKDSYYEMVDINSWHYVRPLEGVSYSLMITGKPWKKEKNTIKYPMRELGGYEINDILNVFKNAYPG